MRISEFFYSLQGEGFLVGVPSVFIRLAGCSLRCRWCDTKYAWEQSAGMYYDIDKVVQEVQNFDCGYVVITGGEPMMDTELPKLVKKLKALGKYITIETAGIAFLPDMVCDLMSISPKLSNSRPKNAADAAAHEDSRLDLAIVGELIDNYDYQLKFVVDSKDDLPEINETLDKLGDVDRTKVLLMPQAKTSRELLAKSPMVAEMCKQTGFAFGQRLHILLWENKPGT